MHRDINPANILLTPEGQAKLLDFGLVRQFRGNQTEPGTALDTLEYIAPEQARMMAALPEDRYPTPQAVLEALAPFRPGASPAGGDHPPPQPVPAPAARPGEAGAPSGGNSSEEAGKVPLPQTPPADKEPTSWFRRLFGRRQSS